MMMPRGANASHRLPLLQLLFSIDIRPLGAVVVAEGRRMGLGRGMSGWGGVACFCVLTLGKHNMVVGENGH